MDFGGLRRTLSARSRRRARIRREVEEELQLHIELRTEELERAGRSHEEARAQAMRDFGDFQDARRYCTGVDLSASRRRYWRSWWSGLRQDVVYALRLLRRSPAFTAATVLVLGIATGAATAAYGVLHTYFVRPLPFPEPDRLMWVVPAPTLDRSARGPSLDAVDWTPLDSLFESTARWDLDGFTVSGRERPEAVMGAWVSKGYMDALGVRAALGRTFAADEYGEVGTAAMISHDLWIRHFGGDPGVIGTTVTAHSNDRPEAPAVVTIVGVIPRDFWPIQWRSSDLLRPLPAEGGMPPLVRLPRNATRMQVQNALDARVRAQLREPVDPAWHMSLVPALARHSASVRPVLTPVLGAALFMLIVACASVAGALIARTTARRGELNVRVALGGGRARLLRQLLTESAVLATVAGAVSIAIAYVLLTVAGPAIERILGTTVPGGVAALRPTFPVVLRAGAVSVLAGIGVGLAPALAVLRLNKVAGIALPGRSAAGRRTGRRVRQLLIAGQVALALILLFGAGLMLRTIERMAGTDLGFRTDGIVAASVLLPQASYADRDARRRMMDRMLVSLEATDGVESAAAVFPLPFWWPGGFPVAEPGSDPDAPEAPRANVYTVSPAYFATMDIPVRAGRTFSSIDDNRAPLVAVISEGLARRLAPEGNALGRRIRVRVPHLSSFADPDSLPPRTVIGIVGDTRESFEATAAQPLPDVYVPYAQNPRATHAIVLRTSRVEQSLFEPARRAVAALDPGLALSSMEALDDLVAGESLQRRGLGALLGGFAAFALGLAALGLYASLSYVIAERRPELAVRVAVGASHRSVLRLVLAEGAAAVAAGVAVGVAGSLALGRVLASQLYGVGPGDAATLVSGSLVLVVAAAAACVAPALSATRTDPLRALRD